jgi:hypothetical protein
MARKVIEFPLGAPPMPDKLPGEDVVSRGVDKILSLMERDPILKGINRLVDKIPIVHEKTYHTPLGDFKTPEFYIPKLTPALMDERKREAIKASVLVDMSSLIAKIPYLGAAAGPAADAVEDTGYAKIHDTLTPEEDKFFKSYDKVDPLSTVAVLRAMVRTQKER